MAANDDGAVKFLSTEKNAEQGLMFKVKWTPAGAAIDIIVPQDDQESDALLQAAAALIPTMALQLVRNGKICHAQCAFMTILSGAVGILRETDPEVYKDYVRLVLEASASKGVKLPEPPPVTPIDPKGGKLH